MRTDYLKTDYDRGFDAGIRQARREALKEAVAACENEQQGFLSPEYATNQPVSSISERFACGQCAGAIRALIDQESKEPLAAPAPMDELQQLGQEYDAAPSRDSKGKE